ncbi:MAG: TonB-dependent receptor [Turneriella sp.]
MGYRSALLLELVTAFAFGVNAQSEPAPAASKATEKEPAIADSQNAPEQEKLPLLRARRPVVLTASRNAERPEDEVIVVETINGDYLSNSGSSNIADALSYQPGLYVSYSASRGDTVQIGGLPPEYSLILINGRRVIGKNEEATSLSRLNLNDLDRIEIVKGAGSAIYGSEAVGGVVNLITRRVSAPIEYKVLAGGGELGKFNLDAVAGSKLGIFSNKTDVSFRQLEQYSVSSADPKLTGRGFGNWQIADQLQFDVMKNWQLGIDVNAVQRRENGVTKTTAYLDERKESQITAGTLFSKSRISDAQQLNVDLNYSYFFDRYVQDFQNPATKDITSDTKENYSSALVHYNYGWMPNQTLTLGTENIWERIESDRIATPVTGTAGIQERTRHAGYAENKWIIWRDANLILQPAVRYDYVSAQSHAVSPRIGFRIDPVRDVTLKASYGWGFRAPSLKELNYDFVQANQRILGNADLKSETSQSYHAGLNWSMTENITLSVNGYYHLIRDKIARVLDRTVGMTQYYVHTNADYAESKSGEAGGEFHFLRYFAVRLGYTYTEAAAQFTTSDPTTKITSSMVRPLDGQATHTGSATFSFDHRHWGLNISISAFGVGERPFYNRTTKQTEYRSPYTDLQFRITKAVGYGTSLFLSGENLTNDFNETTLVRPPRSFWGGIIVQNF